MKKRRVYSIESRGKIQILSEGYAHEKIAKRLKIPKSNDTLACFKTTRNTRKNKETLWNGKMYFRV